MAKVKVAAKDVTRRMNLPRAINYMFGHQSLNFYMLFGTTLFIVVYGMVMVLSSSSVESLTSTSNPYAVFVKQLGFALAGLAGMLAFSVVPVWRLKAISKLLFLGAIGLQLLVLLTPLGVSIAGNRNWLDLGFIRLQPSEFIKLGLILFLAKRFWVRQDEIYDKRRYLYHGVLFIALSVGVVILGKDLGTSIIILLISVGMIYLSGVSIKHMRQLVFVALLFVAFFAAQGASRSGRISAWLSGGTDDTSIYTWQSQHGIWALAAGGWFGSGLGKSELKWSWIPEVDNDYIFAIIGEETGLVGATLVIGLFVFLVLRMRILFLRTDDAFIKNVTAGVMVWIGFQALINIAVVVQWLPVLGVPLPLISAGGSSLISAMFAIGVLLSFEREIRQQELTSSRGRVSNAREPRMVNR
ncbi:MAG: putative peptidoglycan glycosyltransferase FtsW [Actinomycetes bacterium]